MSNFVRVGEREYFGIISLGLVFCGLYGIKLNFIPAPVVYFSFIYYAYLLLLDQRGSIRIVPTLLPSTAIFVIFCFVVLMIYSFAVFVLSGAIDPTIMISSVILALTFIFSWLLSRCFSGVEDFFQKIFILITLQSVFIIASFLFEPFRNIVDFVLQKSFSDVDSGNWRMRGVSNVGGSALSVIQGVGLLIGVSMLLNGSRRFFYVVLSSGLIVLSIFATGKSGLLSLLIAVILVLWVVISTGLVSRDFVKAVMLMITVLPLLLYGLFWIYSNFFQVNTIWGADALYSIFRRGSIEYIQIFLYGKSRTLDYLLQSFQLPITYGVLLFGEQDSWSIFRYTARHIGDSGYLRVLWAFGFLGSILIYFIWFYLARATLKSINNRVFGALIFLVYVWLFVMHFKEPYLLLPPYLFLCSLLFFVVNHSQISGNGNKCES